MPTEPLEYRITFDTSEVAQKLSEVKNAMDVAFGAQAFNAAGPDVFPFQQLFQTSALTNLTGATPATFGVPESLSTAMTSAREGMQMARGTFGDVQNVFNRVAETARLGYSKFTRDLEMTGLMAGGMRGAPQPMAYGDLMQQIRQGDLLDDITGGMGFGYSSTMPMSRREYTRAHKEQAMEDFMEPSWGEAIGVGVGAAFAGGPVGWGLVGIGAAALGTKAALYPFTSELRHQRALESYVRGTSWRFLSGQFNREDTEGLGQYLRELPDQPGIAARDYSRGEIDEMLSTFTEAGGYDYVRTAQDYKEKTKQLFDGHRQLMHTLHVTSKEATALMGQLSRDLGIDNFAAFSGEVGALAEGAGLTRTEAASFMMKSSEMVRGTGYNMADFALSASRMLQDVQNMANKGILSDEDLRQAGGPANIALSMARSAMNYMGSPTGFVTQAALMAAQLGGGGMADMAGMSFQQKLSATAGLLSDPWSILTFDPQKGANAMGPQVALQDRAVTFLDQLSSMGFNQDMTQREFELAARNFGYGPKEANQMSATFAAAGKNLPTLREQNMAVALQTYQQRIDEGETRFGRDVRMLGAGIDLLYWDPLVTGAEKAYTGIEKGVRSIAQGVRGTIFDITGGYFTSVSDRPEGIIAALEIKGGYAATHDRLMAMESEDRAELATRISSKGNVAVWGGINITREIGKRSANDALREVENLVDAGLGRVGGGTSLGGVGGAIAGISGWLAGITNTTAERETINAIADSLDVDPKEYMKSLGRMAYFGAAEYEFALKNGTLKKGETREKFIKNYISENSKTGFGKVLGEKDTKRLNEYIGDMSVTMLDAFVGLGIPITKEDKVTYAKEMRDIAKQKLIQAGTEKPTEEQITAAVGGLEGADIIAYGTGQIKEVMEERQDAADKYGARLRARFEETRDIAYRENDAGGTVFDRGMAEQVNYQQNILSAQALQNIVMGNIKPLPMYVAEKDATPGE